tara:strand:+ start:111 stop:422 length:312 start_codon:yes stop_codon:yes gene_type:complete
MNNQTRKQLINDIKKVKNAHNTFAKHVNTYINTSIRQSHELTGPEKQKRLNAAKKLVKNFRNQQQILYSSYMNKVNTYMKTGMNYKQPLHAPKPRRLSSFPQY